MSECNYCGGTSSHSFDCPMETDNIFEETLLEHVDNEEENNTSNNDLELVEENEALKEINKALRTTIDRLTTKLLNISMLVKAPAENTSVISFLIIIEKIQEIIKKK